MFQNNLLMAAASISAGGITVEDSVRYNDDDSPRLYRTPTTIGNRLTGTISLWYKRCNLGSIQQLFNSGAGNDIGFTAADKLTFVDADSGASYLTTQVFRDPTAWGHLVFAWDTTDTTAGDRLRIYHNGVEITAFDTETDPNLNWGMGISNNVRQTVGANESDTEEFDGYLSQFYYVDGIQNVPTDFGEFDDNNVWRPIEFAADGTGYSGSLVPVMTDYTAPSGEVTFNTEYSSFWKAWYAFNNSWDATNGWIPTYNTMGWLAYEFASSQVITRYVIGGVQHATNTVPTAWTFEGWDGSAWVVLDTQTGITDWVSSPASRKLFTFSNTTSYIKYRIDITADNGGTYVGLNEMMMIGASSGYGTNGFKLDFADSSDFGNDISGNNNDYTSSGLTAADQMSDTPTTNFCVISSIDKSSSITLSDGNLVATFGGWINARATFNVPSSGKWSFQGQAKNAYVYFGVVAQGEGDGDLDTNGTDALYYYGSGGKIATRRSGSEVVESTNAPPAVGVDTNMEVLIDKDNDQFGVVIADTVYMAVDAGLELQDTMTKIFVQGLNLAVTVDFGQGGYEPSQTGYKALNTANLDTPTILDGTANYQTTLYAGTGSSNEVDQSGNSTFQPDFVWIKNRAATDTHVLTNSVTGATKYNASNGVIALTTDTESLKSFDSDGFTVGTSDIVNTNTENFVGWSWKGDSSSGVVNDEGTIDSTIAANPTAGFSVVTWTGTGANGTLGHGLDSAPEFIMGRYSNSAGWWHGWHVGLAGATSVFFFNSSGAASTDTSAWNSTIPTATLISVGSQASVNQLDTTCMQYAWHSVEGYSRISKYIGNGLADGAYVFTGFKPAYVMIKSIGSGSWIIYDSARSPYNEIDDQLLAESNAAETTGSEEIDFLSNGFKCRTADGGINTADTTYLFSAFAEYPFGGDGATPATTF